jgi:DNA-binding response OmpR family regulator
MDAFRIMLVEDDLRVAELEAGLLNNWGYEVLLPDLRADPVAEFARLQPQLVILDVGLPRLDGYEWCARIRDLSKVPILFVTARGGPQDAVRALSGGADDWIAKPFDPEVFTAKVRALLRRAYAWQGLASPILERDGLVFDLERGTATREGRKVELTKNEATLLRKLLERDGRVATRDELMDALWSEDTFVDDNTLTVNMTRLKKALAEVGAEDMVETLRGSGYRIP